MTIRTRFAPSPTGFLHIGSVRTVLFDYLLAKKYHGQIVLRIEDTDTKRRVEGAVEKLLEDLDWLGLEFDEGPHKGGPYGPYVQTERLDIYQKYIKRLVEKGAAYYCFCSKERLDQLRQKQAAQKQPPRYDGHCRHLTKEEVEARIKKGEKFVIRQKMPRQGKTVCRDELRGEIEFANQELDDHVLMKSNGIPTYQLANVVDDHLMKITHVIRGAEWISSLPKNILLYQSFGWEPPKFIHIPLTLNKEGGKLSKRQGDVAVSDYREKGYLPEALLNYSALLGWHSKDDREIFTLEELVKEFSLEGLNVSQAVFDIQKLRWLNGEHLRRKTEEEFHRLAQPYYQKLPRQFDWLVISKLLHQRIEVLGEIPETLDFLVNLPHYDKKLFIHKKMKTDEKIARQALEEAERILAEVDSWQIEEIKEELLSAVKKLGWKNGQLLWPLRVALSGQEFTPGGAIEIAYLLGKEEALKRIKKGVAKLKN